MGFPSQLRSLLGTKRFWIDYFTGRGAYPELRGCEVSLTVDNGFDLVLRIDYDDLKSRSLHVQTPDCQRVQFAHDDDAHPSPWALRWDEVELICQVASFNDPEFEFPGPLLLMLHPFAPLMEGDDVTHIAQLVEASWRSLGMFEAYELQTQVDRIDTRFLKAGFTLNPETGRRTFGSGPRSDRPTKTLQHNRDPSTLAGQAVNQYIARLRQVAQREGSDSLTHKADEKNLAAKGLVPRPNHWISLTIPLDDPTWPLPGPAGKLIRDTINTILASLNLGSCSALGGSFSSSRDRLTDASSLKLVGDRDAGLSVVANLLRLFGVPESASFKDYQSPDPPFSLAAVPVGSYVFHLELSQIEVVEFGSLNEHRFDRRVVDEAVRGAVRAALADSDARITESRGGQLSQVACSDGGALSIGCQALEYDPIGIVVTVEALSVEVAALIHSVASRAGLWILPPVAAPNQVVADSIATNWPPRNTVDAFGLFTLLDAAAPHSTNPKSQ